MEKSEIKVGDRIYWPGSGDICREDTGVVCCGPYGEVFAESGFNGPSVWVKWDSDGDRLHVPICEIKRIDLSYDEEKALKLLRSIGYTCTKEI